MVTDNKYEKTLRFRSVFSFPFSAHGFSVDSRNFVRCGTRKLSRREVCSGKQKFPRNCCAGLVRFAFASKRWTERTRAPKKGRNFSPYHSRTNRKRSWREEGILVLLLGGYFPDGSTRSATQMGIMPIQRVILSTTVDPSVRGT